MNAWAVAIASDSGLNVENLGWEVDLIIDTASSKAYLRAWSLRLLLVALRCLMGSVLLTGIGGCGKESKPVREPLLERATEAGPVKGKISEPGAIAWLGVPFADVTERWTVPKPPRPRRASVRSARGSSPTPGISWPWRAVCCTNRAGLGGQRKNWGRKRPIRRNISAPNRRIGRMPFPAAPEIRTPHFNLCRF